MFNFQRHEEFFPEDDLDENEDYQEFFVEEKDSASDMNELNSFEDEEFLLDEDAANFDSDFEENRL